MSPKYNNEQINEWLSAGAELEFLYFWGPGQSHEARACFNQWHPCRFRYKGFYFYNAEQAMMASKAILFEDWGTLFKILDTNSPMVAKSLGREVRNYDDAKWAAARFQTVKDINAAKFAQNPELLGHLLATKNKILVEASPHDRIWGIGFHEQRNLHRQISGWGQNLLGQALMEVRDLLQFGEKE